MAGKTKHMSQVKQLLRLFKQGYSKRSISRTLGISRNTVRDYLTKASNSPLSIAELLAKDEQTLDQIFHAGNPAYKDERYDNLQNRLCYYAKQLKRIGVTKTLLWQEYLVANPNGYQRSQFCFHLNQYLRSKSPSMVLNHEPADKLFIDFAGKPLSYIDAQTGEIIQCQVFVACLPYSDYSFCMAVKSQKVEDFLLAVQSCLKALGGVPKALVPDNLKSAVIRSNRYEPKINQAFQDLANHYNTTVVPTRAYRPKDKALVENQVKLIYARVYAKIRDRQFFSLGELNQAIQEKTQIHNQTRMQNKGYCRQECFLSKEKPLLMPLPETDFEIKYYKTYKVAQNNHVQLGIDKHYYSVPYQYIGKKVKVIYTSSTVSIFYANQAIAIHPRNRGVGRYSTCKDHLCSTHQHYLNRSPQYYRGVAQKISAEFAQLIDQIFSQKKYPEQLYRSCDGIIRLCRNTDLAVFNAACQIAIDNCNYSYFFLKNIIENKMTDQQIQFPKKPLPQHQNIRGKNYYQ